jgi:hypothetical protein
VPQAHRVQPGSMAPRVRLVQKESREVQESQELLVLKEAMGSRVPLDHKGQQVLMV